MRRITLTSGFVAETSAYTWLIARAIRPKSRPKNIGCRNCRFVRSDCPQKTVFVRNARKTCLEAGSHTLQYFLDEAVLIGVGIMNCQESRKRWADRSGLSIMVCDDDQQLRDILRHQLVFLGHEPTLLGDAGSALIELGTGECDYNVAIIDLQLPDLNGDKLITWLRNSEVQSVRDLPILVLTGRPDLFPTTHEKDLLGNVRLLSKPYSLIDLERNLSDLAGRSFFPSSVH